MRLIFVRHGDPDYENDTVTERGKKEAIALRARAAKWNADKIYCSPLGRARDTAKIALEGSGRTVETKQWLREFHAPIKDPETGEERIPWDLMPSYWTVCPELYDREHWHESDVMLTGNVSAEYKRVCGGIDEILAEYGYIRRGGIYITDKGSDKTIAFFCHLGVELVILSHLFGISAPALWQNFFVAPTSVTVAVTEERRRGEAYFRCKRLGDISHLYAADIEPSDSGFFNEVWSENM